MLKRTVVVAAIAAAGCSGGGNDANRSSANTFVPAGTIAEGTSPGTCVTSSGFEYATEMESCQAADERGRQLAQAHGLSVQADVYAAELAYAVACMAIQGDTLMTYSDPASYDLAVGVDAAGVCPGDLSMLQPSDG